jgi:hypothetical protein
LAGVAAASAMVVVVPELVVTVDVDVFSVPPVDVVPVRVFVVTGEIVVVVTIGVGGATEAMMDMSDASVDDRTRSGALVVSEAALPPPPVEPVEPAPPDDDPEVAPDPPPDEPP